MTQFFLGHWCGVSTYYWPLCLLSHQTQGSPTTTVLTCLSSSSDFPPPNFCLLNFASWGHFLVFGPDYCVGLTAGSCWLLTPQTSVYHSALINAPPYLLVIVAPGAIKIGGVPLKSTEHKKK